MNVIFRYGNNWGRCLVRGCPTETAQNVIVTDGNVAYMAKCCQVHRRGCEFRIFNGRIRAINRR